MRLGRDETVEMTARRSRFLPTAATQGPNMYCRDFQVQPWKRWRRSHPAAFMPKLGARRVTSTDTWGTPV